MKKVFAGIFILTILLCNLAACQRVGDKNASLSLIYGVVAFLSLLLLAGCILTVRKNKSWFFLLFSSVFVVNCGYTLLSVAGGLQMALWANRIAYLGSVFLPLSMLMIILDVTNTKYKKRLSGILFALSLIIFLIAASPGFLPIYYKEVSFTVVDGVSTLVKVYGPLHPLYMVYLLGYFSAMVAVILRARMKKTIDTTAHAVILAIAVMVNIGVWLMEQIVELRFEMLSISYIISELFLLGVHLVMKENQKLREIVRQVEAAKAYSEEQADGPHLMREKPIEEKAVETERVEFFLAGLKALTPTEKAIFDAYIARLTTKEIMASLNIKESTVKYHSRNLYGKLGVSSRKEILEIHKHIKALQIK